MDYIKNETKNIAKFFGDQNILKLSIAFIISLQINNLATNFVNDLLSPLVVAILGKKVSSMDDLYIEINGAKFNYGHFIKTLFQVMLLMIILYYVIAISSKYIV